MFKPLSLPDSCHTGGFGDSLDGGGAGGLIGCPVCMVL